MKKQLLAVIKVIFKITIQKLIIFQTYLTFQIFESNFNEIRREKLLQQRKNFK